MVQQPSYWKVLTRRKIIANEGTEGESKLNRVLGLWDLTALGVGSTLGAGIYVLAGQVAKDQAGPSVMLSFAIAAFASLLAGICYAEFGARVPKAGSAYVYSYVCIGEFAAFVIGWNLILEYVTGTAAVCRGISLYLDTLINDTLKNTFAEVSPMHASLVGSYFDFFAFGLVVVFGVALAFGVENSAMANNFVTSVNLTILLFVVIAGSIKADFSNWTVDVSTVANATGMDLGSGGFFPFGFTGTLKGAATCFFGFVGFDCIATTGEEVRNPRKNIPRSILLSVFIIFLCYFGVSTVLTLMVPYYEQDANAPLPYAFEAIGWRFAMWIVAVGGLVGLLASLFGALFPLPRVMYSMAEDGLLFRFLGKVSPRYRVPVIGSIVAAMFTAVIAGMFDLAQLVSLLSIGTLLAYSVVAISVTILRYMDNSEDSDRENGNLPLSENTMLTSAGSRETFSTVLVQIFNCKRVRTPNALSTRIVGSLITLFCLLSLGIGVVLMQYFDKLVHYELWVVIVFTVLVLLTFLVLLIICLQPREVYSRVFRVPFVPIVPAISIFINTYLMLQLDEMTWVRFGVWMAIGIPIFIACWCMYDIKNPEKRNPKRVEYEKLLKDSARLPQAPMNGNCKVCDLETNVANGSPHTTSVAAQNEHSVKSLDEIMNLNEVSDELIEMKHPNGKVFYIEDTKSNTSTATLEKDEEPKTDSDCETTEDEKSVIAMLDDMLQAEDEHAVPSAGYVPDYSRKVSVDSEMMPSVIETTTVATVHSSSDSSDKELPELLEVEGENSTPSSGGSLHLECDELAQSEFLARQLVDDIFGDVRLLKALETYVAASCAAIATEHESEAEPEPKSQPEPKPESKFEFEPVSTPPAALQRTSSELSLLSMNSVEDPLRSEKFKDKLSQIIMRPPAPTKVTPKANKAQEASESQARPQLKHSKSEADVRHLLFNAIEGTDSTLLDDDASTRRAKFDETGTQAIPKPPKFDPILYKTINSLSANKTRPGLPDKMMKKGDAKTPQIHTANAEALEPPLPFKQKLEAILQRGPSHRTQKRPEVELRRPKSMISAPSPDQIANGGMTTARSATLESPRSSKRALDDPSSPAAVISLARKSLKPVPSAGSSAT